MDICTIVAKNYLAHARVLAGSYREHHPGGRTCVLVIDDFEGYLDGADEPFDLLTPAELEIETFDRMAALYSVLELSTAVKPWLLRHLLHRRGLDRVVYLDPDIEVHDSLDEIDRLLDEHRMVVTPHITEPMPRDGRRPSETEILMSGSFNLGFIGLSAHADTDRLLDWWAERLETDCVVAPKKGLFVDQRWMDFAPGLVKSFHVLRNPGYNVAYWNLSSRKLSHRSGRYQVNGDPLRFFHFSGFDPDHRHMLSKHQDRVEMGRGSALARITNDYGDRLVAHGYDRVKGWPYSWGSLPDGTPVDHAMRQGYRSAVLAGALDGSVHTGEGARGLIDWLNGLAEEGGQAGVTRYLHAYWETRDDLREEYPDLDGRDGAQLVSWAEVYGRGQIPDQLLPGAAGGSYPIRAGVNVAGYFKAVLGVGEHARQVVDALRAQGVPLALVGLRAEASAEGEEYAVEGVTGTPYPVNLVSVNADVLPDFARDVGHGFFLDRYTIGLWAWEVAAFPERYLEAFEHVDEVWVLSRHVADALQRVAPVPVVTVPLPVEVPRPQPRSRADLDMPEGFLFLFLFDHNSVFERKNPLALIEAFKLAFEPGEGPCLVIKTLGAERHTEGHRRLLSAAAGRPDVHVIDRVMTREDKDALIATCDCYVSLHRAEGFGITLAEATALGKPVIATGYSGNLDFMTPENSFLVGHRMVAIGEGHDPYPPEGEWADPDVAHAAELMRLVVSEPETAGARAAKGRRELRARHSREEAGRVMARRLTRIHSFAKIGPRGRRSRMVDTGKVAELVRGGPSERPAPARLDALKRVARRGLLRVLLPYTVHEEKVDNELLSAIHTLDSGLQSVAATQAEMERLMAEARAAPDTGDDFELSEHPVGGVVSGFERASGHSGPGAPFGGPDPVERERLQPHVKLIERREPVLVLGCGRGEVLDLLRAAGLEHRCVEADPRVAEPVRERGHPVESGALLGALGAVDDDSLGALLALELLERLDRPGLVSLLELALLKLSPEGLLVVESPNPHSLAVTKTFWADPARRRPVFPEAALGLCRDAGFGSAFVFHPEGTGNVEADRFHERSYLLAATRATHSTQPEHEATVETKAPLGRS